MNSVLENDRLIDEATRQKLTGLVMRQLADQSDLDDDALKRLIILTIAQEYAEIGRAHV